MLLQVTILMIPKFLRDSEERSSLENRNQAKAQLLCRDTGS